MRDYTVISKIGLAICACLIVLAVINGFTGFLNACLLYTSDAADE